MYPRDKHVSDPVIQAAYRSPTRRRLTVLALLLAFFAVVLSRSASAEPKDAANLPDNLKQYATGTAQWYASPWMTSPACRDRGGDWSVYTQNVIKDLPALFAYFDGGEGGTTDANAKRQAAIVQGYKAIASKVNVPSGYCVNDVRQWAGTRAGFLPFDFQWGNASGHTTSYDCTNVAGADHAACGGFYVSCAGASTQQSAQLCNAWNSFSDDFVKKIDDMRAQANADNPSNGDGSGGTKTVLKSPSEIAQEFVDWVSKHGIEQLVAFVVENVTSFWGSFLNIVIDYTSPNLAGTAFTSIYNLIAGIALALAFFGWVLSLATSWKRGNLQISLLGGIKAVAGVTLAGVGAILMLQLADDCTKSLADAGSNLANQTDFTNSLAKANPLVALIAGFVMALFLLFAIVFFVVHGPLVMMWALFGSIAAAGQVHQASSGWLAKWASRLTALAWAKFGMVGVMLLTISLFRPLDAGEDVVKQIVDVVQGVTMALLLVTTPYLLWELVDFASDRIGGAGASGHPAATMAGSAAGGLGAKAGGAVGTAVSTMMSAAGDIARRMVPGGGEDAGTGSGGSGGSGGGASPPRPEGDGSGSGGGQADGGQGGGDKSGPGGSGGSERPPAGPPGDSKPKLSTGGTKDLQPGWVPPWRQGEASPVTSSGGGAGVPPIPPP